MKPVYTLFFCVSVLVLFQNYAGGPPAGRTGSPGDGATCKDIGCHNDASLTNISPSWITTNVPPKGFIKDSTYTVTITPQGAGHNVFGFEAACQDKTGAKVGTLGLLNTTETQFAGGGAAYIEHTLAGSRGADKSWQFSWKAPSTGNDATFYACVNVANGDGQNTGDAIYFNTLTISRAITTPTNDITAFVNVQVSPYPTSVSANNTVFSFLKSTSGTWNLRLYNIYGALIATHKIEGTGDIQYHLPLYNITSGLYAYSISDDTDAPRATGKLVVSEN